jgi:hypothetical protein
MMTVTQRTALGTKLKHNEQAGRYDNQHILVQTVHVTQKQLGNAAMQM